MLSPLKPYSLHQGIDQTNRVNSIDGRGVIYKKKNNFITLGAWVLVIGRGFVSDIVMEMHYLFIENIFFCQVEVRKKLAYSNDNKGVVYQNCNVIA